MQKADFYWKPKPVNINGLKKLFPIKSILYFCKATNKWCTDSNGEKNDDPRTRQLKTND